MKAAELFVRCLENEGVELIFGIPGEENTDVMDALLDSEIRFITTRHEQAAAFMADVYGRLTGRAGVCLATLGPGATNLVTGVADANMDHAPVVAISGQASTTRMHKESHQYLNLIDLFRPISKYQAQVIQPETIPEVVRKAFKQSEAEKPGVSFIDFPENVAQMEAPSKTPLKVQSPRQPEPAAEKIQQAAEIILSARYPLILAGNGVIRARASRQLLRFASRLQIPVATTFMAKGAIPFSHCLWLGAVGLQAHDYVACGFDRADVIVCVGYDMVEYPPNLWHPSKDRKIIHIDLEPAEVDEYYTLACGVLGNVGKSLDAIGKACLQGKGLGIRGEGAGVRDQGSRGRGQGAVVGSQVSRLQPAIPSPQSPAPSPEPRATNSVPLTPSPPAYWAAGLWRAIMDELCEHATDSGFPMKPQRITWDLQRLLARDCTVICDVGAHKVWMARMYQAEHPNTCIISNGFAAMGISLPGAIAAKLAFPERSVVAVTGDAGFMMNSQEIETALRIGTPIVILIWNDSGYGLIKWHQMRKFGRESHVDFGNPDFVKYAESFGAKGYRVTAADELAPILRQAIADDTVVVIDCPVDYSENMKLTGRLGKLVCPV